MLYGSEATSGLCRTRIALVAGACIAAQTVARFIMAQMSGFWRIAPIPMFGPMTPDIEKVWNFLALWSYMPITARMGALSMGILTAMAVTDERLRQQIGR